MDLLVGRIPFLVCAPFFHGFLGREGEFPRVRFVDGPPSLHSKGLREGTIHLSPASSITFAQKPGAFVLSPDFCTSCSFEVRSVKLFSRFPVESLDGKVVRLTSQSQTSVALLKILLQERYRVRPDFVQGLAADPADDACLLIGDLALEETERHRFAYSYDLGTLWQDWQGMPFVFGAWIIEKSALAPTLRPTLETYLQETERSVEAFRADPAAALDRWISRFPVNLDKKAVLDYYKIIDYHFTDERKKSLEVFFGYAAKLGLVEKAPPLEFL
jgi:chorismate dehydratase